MTHNTLRIITCYDIYKTSSSKVHYWAQGSWWLLLCLAGCVQSMGMGAMMGPTIRKQQSMLKQNTTKKMHKYYTQTSMNIRTIYNKLNTTNTISKHQINFLWKTAMVITIITITKTSMLIICPFTRDLLLTYPLGTSQWWRCRWWWWRWWWHKCKREKGFLDVKTKNAQHKNLEAWHSLLL